MSTRKEFRNIQCVNFYPRNINIHIRILVNKLHQLVFVFARLPCNVCYSHRWNQLWALWAMVPRLNADRSDIVHVSNNMDLHHEQQELNQNWRTMTKIKYLQWFAINKVIIFQFSYFFKLCNIIINF
jgi:hypothetical protein